MGLVEHLNAMQTEASRLDERRLALLVGGKDETNALLERFDAQSVAPISQWVAVGDEDGPWEIIAEGRTDQLLGRTLEGLYIDINDALRPNTIGQSIGAVRGGGLIVLHLDDIESWLERPLSSDGRFAVLPYGPEDVGRRFRRRFIAMLRAHRGISILDVDASSLVKDGLTDGEPIIRSELTPAQDDRLAMCLTADQRRCVRKLDDLLDGEEVLVIEAHRGRGKSSAAGIAAAGFAQAGHSVLVTGPGFRSIQEVFNRAREWLGVDIQREKAHRFLRTSDAGEIGYHPPDDVLDHVHEADVILVDEAAAIPVDILNELHRAGVPIAYLTTVHGYEGTGRGFAVRFRDTLERSVRRVRYHKLTEPIRYAPGDPIEIWQFRTLMLDASPPAGSLIDTARPDSVTYEVIDRDELADDEALLRELFGLLVLAHYRTEPDDLARLLDAPNVSIRALTLGSHPVSVALLAEEGGLEDDWRDRLYHGESIRGHMIPDLLTTQLRDREAGSTRGIRFLRIATHDAVRSVGLGSTLVGHIKDEFTGTVDWLGAGYGMTPDLLRFWSENGYRTVHLGTSRNPRSGEHSAVMMYPLSETGEEVVERHTKRLLDRLEGQLTDALREVDPETVCQAIATIDGRPELDLPSWVWDVIETTPDGPGQIATAPHGFRALTIAALITGGADELTSTQRELLVRRVLQSHGWPDIMADHPELTRGDARRNLQSAIRRITEHWRRLDDQSIDD